MNLDFLNNPSKLKENTILYLLDFSTYNIEIRKDILEFLENNTSEIEQNIINLVLKHLIDVSSEQEFNQILGLFAINNIQSIELIEYALDKHLDRTAVYVKNHINKNSILIDITLTQITNKLIKNIENKDELEIQQIDLEKYENLRDIWLELIESNKHNKDLINSIFKQLLIGFVNSQEECRRQCYLVDLLVKTKYGTHYAMDKYPEVDMHFLESLKRIANRLDLHNKTILTYLFLNNPLSWPDLYNAATELNQHIGLDHTSDDLQCMEYQTDTEYI